MSRAPIVTVISQKGGAGKTTVTMQLAAAFARTGLQVEVVDLDVQESASRWASAGTSFPARMHRFKGDAHDLPAKLTKWRKRADIVLIDCPPALDHPRSLAALLHTSLALIPVVPSPTDLWSTRAVEHLILELQAKHPGMAAALLPNRVTRTSLAANVLELMREFELPILRASLGQRAAYAQSAALGASVFELGSGAQLAQREVERLREVVSASLEGRA